MFRVPAFLLRGGRMASRSATFAAPVSFSMVFASSAMTNAFQWVDLWKKGENISLLPEGATAGSGLGHTAWGPCGSRATRKDAYYRREYRCMTWEGIRPEVLSSRKEIYCRQVIGRRS